jgi:hypothetical protein
VPSLSLYLSEASMKASSKTLPWELLSIEFI